MNNRGTIVGHSRSTDWVSGNGDYLVHGYVLADSKTYEIGSYGQTSRAVAVNEKDVVTGDIAVDGYSRAFQWQDGVVTLLGHLGGLTSRGKDIANSNHAIVGDSADAKGFLHSALWDGTNLVDLGMLPGDTMSSANAINELHQIVGASGTTAVLWQFGQILDLNDHVALPAPVRLVAAIDINNHGEILAKGSDGKFYLLTRRTNGAGNVQFKGTAQPN